MAVGRFLSKANKVWNQAQGSRIGVKTRLRRAYQLLAHQAYSFHAPQMCGSFEPLEYGHWGPLGPVWPGGHLGSLAKLCPFRVNNHGFVNLDYQIITAGEQLTWPSASLFFFLSARLRRPL